MTDRYFPHTKPYFCPEHGFEVKLCPECSIVKPLSDFGTQGKRLNWRIRNRCKVCVYRYERQRSKESGYKSPIRSRGTCEYCGSPIVARYQAKKPRFCSKKCAFAWRTAVIEKPRPAEGVTPQFNFAFFSKELGGKAKRCAACHIDKRSNEFYVLKTGGLHSYCKSCIAAKQKGINARRDKAKWKAVRKAYHRTHLQQYADRVQNYRARKKKATLVGKIDRAAVIKRDRSTCYWCRRVLQLNEISLDHIIPISKGGTHSETNLTVSCKPCNSSKGAKLLQQTSFI